MKTEMALCFYPTSVVFIDDNASFLSAIQLSLSSVFNCLSYQNPIRALNELNHRKRFDNTKSSRVDDADGFIKEVLNQSVAKMEDEMRYQEISVVVVDYDMPHMNGLEFCRHLRDANIKKILLTGQAGFAEAVAAFNDNIIDFYVQKSHPNLNEHLKSTIQVMQQRYFLDMTSFVKARAIDAKNRLFNDPYLARYFLAIVEQLGIREYYFLTHPIRYQLVKENGTLCQWLIYSRLELNEHIRIIKEEGGPDWLLEALKTGHYVPYFQTTDGYFNGEIGVVKDCLYPAEVVRGHEDFYCALIQGDHQPLSSLLMTTLGPMH